MEFKKRKKSNFARPRQHSSSGLLFQGRGKLPTPSPTPSRQEPDDTWSLADFDTESTAMTPNTERRLKQLDRVRDSDRWEENRLHFSGAVKLPSKRYQNEDNDADRVVVLIRNLAPPFLSESFIFTT